LFGSGKTVGVQLNTSRANKVYSLSYTDPYYTLDGVSRGFDIYRRKTDTSRLSTSIATYDVSSWGGGVRYGVPIADEQSISFGLAVDSTTLGVNIYSPFRYQEFVAKNGNHFNSVVGSIGWGEETIDSRVYPTRGGTQRAGAEVGLPGGDLRFYRLNYQKQEFLPLSKTFTLLLNGEVGVAGGYGGRDLPFWKNYYAGGIGSVRGFESGSIGPRDPLTLGYLGGTRRLVGNAELLFPLPGGGTDKSLRLGAFLDIGGVGGQGQGLAVSDLRASTGLSVLWSSFMGPIKVSFAQPLKKQSDDKVQRLQFQMGTTF
jgi:outer membrane protein insertion porin family